MSLTTMPVPAMRPGGPASGCDSGGSCDCGGAAVGQPAFVRPRFFAGQLLTEDDLELLASYVTGKSRLHDRYLFGPGVVCGLRVVCDPCGGAKVRVLPGYALDCCGNDIVVACPEELDINALVRDLRTARLGKDCGDPCTDDDDTSSLNGSRHYCLYLRYAEELTDPVAPYATEEPCGHQGCEPSRVREGFRFLLKCDEHRTPREKLETRVHACLPPEKDEDVTRRLGRLDRYVRVLLTAAPLTDTPVAFEATDAQRIEGSQGALATALAAREKGAEIPDDTARSMTEAARELAGALVRLDLQDEATRARLVKDHPKLDLDGARTTLASAADALGVTVDRVWDDRLDREVARALIGQAARVAGPTREPLAPVEARVLAQGQAFGSAVWDVLLDDEAALKEWLLDRLDQTPSLSDCELRTLVAAIPVTAPAERDTDDRLAVRRTGTAATQLIEAVRRYVVDCVCAAINPPCVPCTDTDVLLACLEVKDCDVVKICNATRDYVLSGPALRYWIPALDELRDQVEEFCCGPGEAPSMRELLALLDRFGLRPPALAAKLEEPEPRPAAADPIEQLGTLRNQVTELKAEIEDAQSQLAGRVERLETRARAPSRSRAKASAPGGRPKKAPAGGRRNRGAGGGT
jgi:hypothetical protein